MKTKRFHLVAAALLAALGGCEGYNRLTDPHGFGPAPLTTQPASPDSTPAAGGAQNASAQYDSMATGNTTWETSLVPSPPAQGIYSFTFPPEVTRVKHTTESFEQYQLYWGTPEDGATPFLTIWVGNQMPALEVERPDSGLRMESSRAYVCNGLATREWTGYTVAEHLPFVELTMKHPGAVSTLHAIAVADSSANRQVALDILGSITWEPKN